MRRTILALLLAAAIFAASGAPAAAWGLTGHRLLSRAGAAHLPEFLPAFMRSAAALDEITELGPELDRSKGAGLEHDNDLDPGHYLDIGDDNKIFGAVSLDALPLSRRDYDTALRAVGSNEYVAGYLPYALIDGWQQLRQDFAFWRVDRAGETQATAEADKRWFAADRRLRETLTLRDLGVWSHYVGDASQPLHITIHFNGWGNFPNPNNYSTDKTLHSKFESAFVVAHGSLETIAGKMRAYHPCSCSIENEVGSYLRASAAQVTPLYEIEKRGGFAGATPEAIDFVNSRLADGATMLRNLIGEAWESSATHPIGYPQTVTPADAEAGKTSAARIRPSRD